MSHESDPSKTFFAITPSDTVDFTNGAVKGIYVGGAGNVVAVNAAGVAVLFTAVPVGTILPIQAVRVNDTSTTATALVGL